MSLADDIAREVMGWELALRGYSYPNAVWVGNAEKVMWVDDWRPDADIAQAWMVVERMREDGWHLVLTSTDPTSPFPGPFEAIFTAEHGGEMNEESTSWWSGYGEAPEAICRAALAAKRGE